MRTAYVLAIVSWIAAAAIFVGIARAKNIDENSWAGVLAFGLFFLGVFFAYFGNEMRDLENINFNNSEYQNDPLSTDLQNEYYVCLEKECGGTTYDYDCAQKCYLKSMKKGMPSGSFSHMGNDIQSMVCSQYADTEDQYYLCLNQLYSQYRTN